MALLRRRTTLLALPGLALAGHVGPVRAQGGRMQAATQLGWLRNGEFAPLMVAEAKGYFAEAGIDHRIVDGGPGKNPVPTVAVGQAQFGLATSGLHLIAARTARDPVDVVAVGALYQTAPSAYLTLRAPSDPDPVPKDMEGKTVGVQAGSEYFIRAIARKNGADEAKIRIVTVQANAEPLMVGRVDFFSGWITNQAYQIEVEAAKPDAPPALKGKTWKALRFADWGLPAYSDVVFTTRKVTEENPELVRAYLRAVSKGMRFILDHPQEAVEIVARFPGQIEDAGKLAWRWRVQNPLFVSPDTERNGLLWMSPQTWDQMAGFLHEAKEVPRLVAASEMMDGRFFPGTGAA